MKEKEDDESRNISAQDFRSEDILVWYRRHYLNHTILSDETTRRLIKEAQVGDKKAMETLLRHNQRLIYKKASQNQGYGVPLIDMVQEANRGFIRAIIGFDLTRTTKLSTYAAWWMRQKMTIAPVQQSTAVSISRYRREKLQEMNQLISVMIQELGREPTDTEVIARAPEELRIERTIHLRNNFICSFDAVNAETNKSLYDYTPHEGMMTPEDVAIARDELIDFERHVQLIIDAIEAMDIEPWWREAFYMFYGINGRGTQFQKVVLREVVEELHVSGEGVRQAVKKIWARLKWRKGLPSRADFENILQGRSYLQEVVCAND